ncbi:MAG: hypothetical protein JW995_11070 [Melioribacteraceae bacterium]|nr:hypothetical protein [Melioribacteraceae bacterium]
MISETIEVKKLEEQIIDYLKQIILPKQIVDWAVKIIQSNDEIDRVTYMHQLDVLKRSKLKILNRLKSLLDLRLDNELSKEDYEIKRNELDVELRRLDTSIAELEVRSGSSSTRAEEAFVFSSEVLKRFRNGSDIDKKLILASIGSILKLIDRKLDLEIKKPFSLIDASSLVTDLNNANMSRFESDDNHINRGTMVICYG